MTWESGEYYNKPRDTHTTSGCGAQTPSQIRQKRIWARQLPLVRAIVPKAHAFNTITKIRLQYKVL